MNRVQAKKVIRVARYRRLCLAASFVALVLAFIAKYYVGPFERFADAYLGDVFIVICLYFWLAILAPQFSILSKFMVIAAVACCVEFLQLTGFPARLNLGEPFVFILGTSFDPYDFIFYALGLTSAVLLDVVLIRWGRS
jgi:hypothetical protein